MSVVKLDKKVKVDLDETPMLEKRIPQLPSIIYEQIIHRLVSNNEALRMVARTCKEFYDLATPLLYRHIRLDSEERAKRLFEGINAVTGRALERRTGVMERDEKMSSEQEYLFTRVSNFKHTRHIELDFVTSRNLQSRIKEIASDLDRKSIFPALDAFTFGPHCFLQVCSSSGHCNRHQLTWINSLGRPSRVKLIIARLPPCHERDSTRPVRD